MKTQLKSYELWYDGDVVIKANDIERFITKVPSNKLFVDKVTKDIKQFNALMSRDDAITTKEECKPLNFDWDLPEYYLTLDVKSHVLRKLEQEKLTSDEELEERFARVLTEVKAFAKLNLINLLRCLIYIVDTFTKCGIVWGVGRGSSVSSYVLYLIGVHDIDSVQFELPFTDFVKHE
jgi:DNA polymerase III alpha subunit